MGVVYGAYDPQLDRRVAIKLLQRTEARVAGAGAHGRLLREAQSMALLSHPNVITVHDVGEHEGRVYLAMEFLEGVTLRAWCSSERRHWRDVLDVFMAAGRGLAAAHDCGLVHRDFKPENVMVTPEPGGIRVRVMDFGLARPSSTRAEDDEGETSGTGGFHSGTVDGWPGGTPAYMAPEQHHGLDVEPAADQFAFCVALWEGLYGERPFGGRSAAVLALEVTEGVRRAAPRGSSVPAWVRQACDRGLSREPSQRFESMHALLEHLQRGARALWVRRIAAAVAATAVLGAAVAIFVAWNRARTTAACEADGAAIEQVWNDERQREVREALVATGLSYAEQTADRFAPWVDAHVAEWAEARTEACLQERLEREWSPEMIDRAGWCLDDRRMAIEALVDQVVHSDAQSVSRVVLAASLPTSADRCVDPVALARTSTPPPADRAAVRELWGELAHAHAMRSVGDGERARRVATDALARAEALGWPPLHAALLVQLGWAEGELGDHEAAERYLEHAYFEAIGAGEAEIAGDAAHALVYILGYRQRRVADGRRWARHSAALAASQPDPEGLRRASALENLALVDLMAGDYPQAGSSLEEALRIREKAMDPKHPRLANTLNNVANARVFAGDYAGARSLLERAATIQEEALGPEHPDLALTLSNLGDTLTFLGAYADARRTCERSLAIFERALGPDHPDVGRVLANLAGARAAMGDGDDAAILWERALAIFEKALGPDHITLGPTLVNLAILAYKRGDYERAARLLERTLEIREAALDSEHPDVADGLFYLATVRGAQGDLDEAIEVRRRVLAMRERHLGPEHPAVADSLAGLAVLFGLRGSSEASAPLLARALEIRERAFGPEHPSVADALDAMAEQRRAIGALDEAQALGRRALAIREAALGRDHPDVAQTLVGLARTAEAQGRAEQAGEFASRAIPLVEGDSMQVLTLAEAKFVLARATWDVGTDRTRAWALATEAREAYRTRSGAREATALAEIEAWIRAHRSR
jgi:tetratricopeptide (TPR) repeat protein